MIAQENVKMPSKGKASRSDRYRLQRVAQSLLYKPGKDQSEQKRVCWCHRSMLGDVVPVYRAVDGSRARFSNLTTCGSVWDCPVCAVKVAEARREELQAAMVSHCRAKGSAYLVTLTFPHESDHEINDLLARFDKARTYFKNCRAFKKILGNKRDKATGNLVSQGSAEVLGIVSSLEVTVSLENGWHPHLHMLVFAKREGLHEVRFDGTLRQAENGDLESPEIDTLKKEWTRLLLKNGLGDASKTTDMLKHGLNVRGGEHAAEYIAKMGRDERWGQSRELTTQHAKIGSAGGPDAQMHFTPFQLLAWADNGDGWAMARFREYSDAFQGKRMITWSPRLKRDLALKEEDRTDEEIAAADLPEDTRAGELTEEQFTVILTRNAMGDFLRYVAESCCNAESSQEDIDGYIDALRSLPATHGKLHRLRQAFGGGFAVST